MNRTNAILAAIFVLLMLCGMVFIVLFLNDPAEEDLGGLGQDGAQAAPEHDVKADPAAEQPGETVPGSETQSQPEKPAKPGPGPGSGPDRTNPDEPIIAGQVGGRVVDSRTGKPVEGAAVSVRAAGAGQALENVTDQLGRFRISGIQDSEVFTLSASKAGYAPYSREGLALACGAGLDVGDISATPIPLISGAVALPGGEPAASGTVALATDYSLSFGPDFDLLEFLKKAATLDPPFASAQCGKDGSFAFYPGDVADGTYCLRASAPGFATVLVHRVKIEAGVERARTTVCLKPAAKMFGTVSDKSGLGLSGALVVALAEPDDAMMLADSFSFGKYVVVSSEGGKFEMADLPEGSYVVIASKEGYARSVRERVKTSGQKALEIVLETGLSVKGRVTDESTGKPVAGARILAMSDGGAGSGSFGEAVSGPDGGYRIENLSPMKYRMAAMAKNYKTLETDFDGRSGGEAVKDLRLTRGVRISGRVLDASGRAPIEGAMVVSIGGFSGPMPGADVKKASTAADGSFTLDGVTADDSGRDFFGDNGEGEQAQPGPSHPLIVIKTGWFMEDVVFKAAATGVDQSGIEILLHRCGLIKGRVEGPDGKPVSGASVDAYGKDMDRRFET